MNKASPVITLDGLSGAGKGTVGLKIAHALGWSYLDSGVLYRLLALEAIQQSVELQDEEKLANLAFGICPALSIQQLPNSQLKLHVAWKNKNIIDILRTEDCAVVASQIAAYPLVRQALLEAQRSYRKSPGLIADGRDMGQVIFPDACYKFFLTASVNVRTQRRYEQLKEQGNYASLSAVKNAIVARDKNDQVRLKESITALPRACVIDTTSLSILQVVTLVKKKLSTVGLYFH